MTPEEARGVSRDEETAWSHGKWTFVVVEARHQTPEGQGGRRARFLPGRVRPCNTQQRTATVLVPTSAGPCSPSTRRKDHALVHVPRRPARLARPPDSQYPPQR